MTDLRPSPTPSTTTPATAPTEDRPPRTPRWVWLFGIVVGLFLLAVGAFFVVSGDHGAEAGGGVHGAGNDPSSVERATAPDVLSPAWLRVATARPTLWPITVPVAPGAAGTLCFVVSCPDGEPLTEFTDTEAPAARTSRLFLDFQVGGQVRTADVTLEASAPARAGQDARSADREPTRCGR